jgi:RNA polymerase sigma factor (sigma-70 family)
MKTTRNQSRRRPTEDQMATKIEEPSDDSARHVFNTTHWSAVLNARDGDTPAALAAFEELCNTYWMPLYAFLRRSGQTPHDAQDLVQGFFARFTKNRLRNLRSVNPDFGKFRSFLLASLKNFARDQSDYAHAIKRGGGTLTASLDKEMAEERYLSEPATTFTPDQVYDRQCANAILEQALVALGDQMSRAGKRKDFEALAPFLQDKKTGRSYAEVAAELGTTEGAVRCAVPKLRGHFRELVRMEIAKTLEHPTSSAVDEELACIIQALG